MKVMIVTQQALFKAGLTSLLKEKTEFEVVEGTNVPNRWAEQVLSSDPEIVIMGGDLFQVDGKNLIRSILEERPAMAFLILALNEGPDLLLDAIRFGAKGYMLENVPEDVLIKSLYAIGRGEVAFSRSLMAVIVEEFHRLMKVIPENGVKLDVLTYREYQVFRCLARDATNKEIGLKLFISENTVRIHVRNILRKLKMRNRREAGEFARRTGSDMNRYSLDGVFDQTGVISIGGND